MFINIALINFPDGGISDDPDPQRLEAKAEFSSVGSGSELDEVSSLLYSSVISPPSESSSLSSKTSNKPIDSTNLFIKIKVMASPDSYDLIQ